MRIKHVYILGAGFSVPLGGPLFAQLLTRELDVYWEQLPLDDDRRPWRQVLEWIHGRIVIQSTFRRQLNAEELLAQIDRFANGGDCHMAQRLYESIGRSSFSNWSPQQFFQKLDRMLKRVLAIECDGFLDQVEADSELWDPYKQWFSKLGADDTIINFNYDTAVERLSRLCERPYARLHLCMENDPQFVLPKLIKLHGSADWFGNSNQLMQSPQAYMSDNDIAIATPGMAKANMHRDGHFKRLMTMAMEAIQQANVLSIIGYSMPETDNRSRMAILKAIDEGFKKKRLINVVLGPDSGTIRAKRMKAIIEPHVSKDRCPVVDRPMYAQDFLPDVDKYVDLGPEGPLFMTSA